MKSERVCLIKVEIQRTNVYYCIGVNEWRTVRASLFSCLIHSIMAMTVANFFMADRGDVAPCIT